MNDFRPNCKNKSHNDIPLYACPKCGSTKIIIYGAISAYANSGQIYSVEYITSFKCEKCDFTEDWIEEDGSAIFSKLEEEWMTKCPCKQINNSNNSIGVEKWN